MQLTDMDTVLAVAEGRRNRGGPGPERLVLPGLMEYPRQERSGLVVAGNCAQLMRFL